VHVNRVKIGAAVIVLVACLIATALLNGWAAIVGAFLGFGLLALLARREQRRARALPESESASEARDKV
jgi:hypothetical protein